MPPKKDYTGQAASSSGVGGVAADQSLQFVATEIGKLSKLNLAGCTLDTFDIWLQRWNSVTTITNFHALPRNTQKALFTNALTDDTVRRMNILHLDNVEEILNKFKTQVCGETNIFVFEYEFHKRVQGSNESFEEFYNGLQVLFHKCQNSDCCRATEHAFMPCKDRILLGRLVAGIKSNDVRKKLLSLKDLTLQKAVQAAKLEEATSSQVPKFSSPSVNQSRASSYKQNKSQAPMSSPSTDKSNKHETAKKCKCCLRIHIFRKELCPATDSLCRICNQIFSMP